MSSKEKTSKSLPTFPIVGIGASAGGLEAFTQLLEELPLDTGMAFVLVQHLAPTHESALTEILTKVTKMPVRQITDNLEVEPNHIYVIPPNTDLIVENRILHLKPRQDSARARSVDVFFQSLAEDCKEGAIAVILSGTASDGTQGAEAVKAEGGIVFAQDESAKFDSMPHNVIDSGCADLVLSPAQIAEELARLGKQEYPAKLKSDDPSAPISSGEQEPGESFQENHKDTDPDGFPKIITLLHQRFGIDFSLYKPSTLERRILRRIAIRKLETFSEYADLLQREPEELDKLYKDILIGVTSFFRNPEAFDVLREKILPELLSTKRNDPLRFWVPGCSSGQEAFSLAISYAEFAETVKDPPKLQIFATDINEESLIKARRGLFTKDLVEELSEDRLKRFFVEETGGYRLIKRLRETILFARQNLLGDPPFSRLDLISCRNLMIYFEAELQQKVLPLFHYALNTDGILFLGAAESISSYKELFEPIDKKTKFFRKTSATAPLPHRRSTRRNVTADPVRAPAAVDPGALGETSELAAQREADRLTVNRFAPPSVLIDESLQILQFRGKLDLYLQTPTGTASFNLLKMARTGLMLPLRTALETAMKSRQSVWKETISWHQDDETTELTLEVTPLKNLKKPYYLILFFDPGSLADEAVDSGKAKTIHKSRFRDRSSEPEQQSRRMTELEDEITEARDYIQSLQEQYDASHSEFQTSNEEVQSANEELQSTNEELETSKEELESTNEELASTNEELANRNTELHRANSDLLNLQTSVHTAIVLLGSDLTIRRFSPEAEKAFNLTASDIGRPLKHIAPDFIFPDLEEWVQEIADTAADRSREVQDKTGYWYSLRGSPYRTIDNEIDGAVLMLVDIHDLKRIQTETEIAHDYQNAILNQVPPILILNADLRVIKANTSFSRHFKISRNESMGQLIYDLGNKQWDIPALRGSLEKVLSTSKPLKQVELTHHFESIGSRVLVLDATKIKTTQTILLSIDDITDQRAVKNKLKELNHTLENRIEKRTTEIQKRVKQLQQLSLHLVDTEHRERRRLATILHDDLQQILVATQMHASIALGPTGKPEQGKMVLSLILEAIETTRKLAKGLAPPILHESGLVPGLDWLVQWTQERFNLNMEVKIEGEINPTDPTVNTILFEAIRELILNVVKHAKTDRVQVNLSNLENNQLRLEVRDFGQGFDPAIQKKKGLGMGMGMFSLKERLTLMNGKMKVESAPGQGTCIEIIMPLESS